MNPCCGQLVISNLSESHALKKNVYNLDTAHVPVSDLSADDMEESGAMILGSREKNSSLFKDGDLTRTVWGIGLHLNICGRDFLSSWWYYLAVAVNYIVPDIQQSSVMKKQASFQVCRFKHKSSKKGVSRENDPEEKWEKTL